MRNRGNNAVAPRKDLLKLGKEGKIVWNCYKRNYLKDLRSLSDPEPYEWMKKTADESKRANVILVCYEKDYNYCHRKLLAEEITKEFNAEYNGELSIENIK